MLGEDHTRDQLVFCYQCKSKHPMMEIGPHYEECMKPNQKCPWCAKIFSATSGGLDIHRKTVHFWGNFKCPTCNAKSHFAKDLIEHMQAEGHTDDPLVNCPQCRNRFHVDEISAHYMTCVSSGWKLKKCLRCKKKFSQEELVAHQGPNSMDYILRKHRINRKAQIIFPDTAQASNFALDYPAGHLRCQASEAGGQRG